jgi:hypothetical protein
MSVTHWYHGTDVTSGLALLNGMDLDPAEAAARKKDGPPGFFLAERADDASYFAWRRQGTILEIRLSENALRQLITAGAMRQPIPPGKRARFKGDELAIPPQVFGVFNQLRATGEITIVPAKWP